MSQKKGDRKILAKKTHIFVEVKEKLRHKPVVGSGEVWGSGWKTMRRQYDKTALSTAPRFDGSWFWDAWPCSFASKEVFGSRYISSTFLWETAELRAWSRASCTRSRRPCGSFIDWQSASFRGCKTTENKKMMTWKPSEFWYEFLYFKFKLRSFSVVFWTKQKGIFKKNPFQVFCLTIFLAALPNRTLLSKRQTKRALSQRSVANRHGDVCPCSSWCLDTVAHPEKHILNNISHISHISHIDSTFSHKKTRLLQHERSPELRCAQTQRCSSARAPRGSSQATCTSIETCSAVFQNTLTQGEMIVILCI